MAPRKSINPCINIEQENVKNERENKRDTESIKNKRRVLYEERKTGSRQSSYGSNESNLKNNDHTDERMVDESTKKQSYMMKGSNGSSGSIPKLSNYNSNTIGLRDEGEIAVEIEDYRNNYMKHSNSAIMPK